MWRLPYALKRQHCDIFNLFDVDNAGVLQRDKFHEALRLNEYPADVIDNIFDGADINGDDVLEFNEFAVMSFDWHSLDRHQLKCHVQEVVCDLNPDNLDELTLDQLEVYFSGAVPLDELSSLIQRVSGVSGNTVSSVNILNFLEADNKWASLSCESPFTPQT